MPAATDEREAQPQPQRSAPLPITKHRTDRPHGSRCSRRSQPDQRPCSGYHQRDHARDPMRSTHRSSLVAGCTTPRAARPLATTFDSFGHSTTAADQPPISATTPRARPAATGGGLYLPPPLSGDDREGPGSSPPRIPLRTTTAHVSVHIRADSPANNRIKRNSSALAPGPRDVAHGEATRVLRLSIPLGRRSAVARPATDAGQGAACAWSEKSLQPVGPIQPNGSAK